jgi:hypothetical protein
MAVVKPSNTLCLDVSLIFHSSQPIDNKYAITRTAL